MTEAEIGTTVQVIAGVAQLIILPLLAVVWKMLNGKFDSVFKRLDCIDSKMVTKELCHQTHEPINRLLAGELQEHIGTLRERVAVLEAQIGDK